jgi:hypothetical protein
MSDELRCSFCHKKQETVGKLISSPSDYPRAYICDECIATCHYILEDDKNAGRDQHAPATMRFVDHPAVGEFLEAAERWAVAGCPIGADSSLEEVRKLATRMLADAASAAE